MKLTEAFRESTTLKLVVPAWFILLGKFAVGGLDFGFGEFPAIGATEFGFAVAAVLAIWLGREVKEVYKAGK